MKPAKWIRDDLQKKYDKLVTQQQPLLREHRELCEKVRKHKAENGTLDTDSIKKIRVGNKKIADLEKQKQILWDENLNHFRGLTKK